jgi:hypothetical protein
MVFQFKREFGAKIKAVSAENTKVVDVSIVADRLKRAMMKVLTNCGLFPLSLYLVQS